jgi:pyruvoyl-dependent arginine decarboxylase (PvlArgDC)
MFRASLRPSSGVPKTVSATSGVGHGTGTATSFHRGLIRTGVGEFDKTVLRINTVR